MTNQDEPMFNAPAVAAPRSASTEVEVNRAMAEVQASVVLAKKFPRDVDVCLSEIMRECNRVQLAEGACYAYSKGGTKIEGPSIRLAEALKASWGNIHSGWRELSRTIINGAQYAEIEAWAWDLEKNNREPVVFKVKFWRDTRQGGYAIKDEREIYELCANQAKRRERSAILSVIPGWVQDMAVEACKETLKKTVTPEITSKIIAAFDEQFGVKKEQIEKFTQCNVKSITAPQVVRLRSIFASLRDGMSKPDDWFDPIDLPEQKKPQSKGVAGLKEKLKSKEEANASENPPLETGPIKSDAPDAEQTSQEENPANVDPETGEIFEQITAENISQLLQDMFADIDAADPDERAAVFVQHRGPELLDASPNPEAEIEMLAMFGVNVIINH